jgi:hypothetical protein
MYLTLTALIQLNLIATRNPSFWWRFSKKTAPRCATSFLLPADRKQHAVCCGHVGGRASASTACAGNPLLALVQLCTKQGTPSAVLLGFEAQNKCRKTIRIRARRPSLLLLLPVACFLLGATLIAVYWPLNVEPDGGRGAMDGAGTAFRPPWEARAHLVLHQSAFVCLMLTLLTVCRHLRGPACSRGQVAACLLNVRYQKGLCPTLHCCPPLTGWAAIGIAWAYVIIWWLLADLAKTLVSKVSPAADPAADPVRRDQHSITRHSTDRRHMLGRLQGSGMKT